MESYTRWDSPWDLHRDAIAEMRDHVNEVGRTLTKLDEARAGASPWQMTAIDRIKPLLHEIAANTASLIQMINKNPKRMATEEYKDYIEANADESAQLSQLIADFVNYGNSKNRMDHLGAKIEVPQT